MKTPAFTAIKALPSLLIPMVLVFIALIPTAKDKWDLSPASTLLFTITYITVLYAIAGGFEPSRDISNLSRLRMYLFLILGGLGLALLLGIFWIFVDAGLKKLFKMDEP